MITLNYFEDVDFDVQKQKALDEKCYSLEMLKAFRKNIKKVSPDEAQKLGSELLELVSSSDYAKNENIAQPTTLIFEGADLETKNSDHGETGLIFCAKKNLYKTFSLYAKAGANIDAQNSFLTTASMWSARKGWTNILSDLILLGANINLQCRDGDTALISATRHSMIESVRILIQANVILNSKNNHGEDALSIALLKGYTDIANLISTALKDTMQTTELTRGCSIDEVQNELQLAKEKLKKLTL